MESTIYLDYAATSAVRPPEVADAVAAYLRDVGATPGRATHARALGAGRVLLHCRRLLADLFAAPGDPGRIVMQYNATHALNTALYGILGPGDRVVRTTLDHNSIRRPVAHLTERGIDEAILEVDADGNFDPAELRSLLEAPGARPRLLVLPHASNVTGAVLSVREMADIAHSAGAMVLLDAAQTVGHLPVAVDELQVDLLAFPGHKGLLGPQGTGGLWVRDGIDVAPLLRGGTGGDSIPADMPDSYPDHLEAGTQNAPGIAGLIAGLEWLHSRGVKSIHAHEQRLASALAEGLQKIPGVRLCSSRSGEGVGIVTLLLDGWPPGALADAMDRRFGVQGRAGLHCAPEAHAVLGTLDSGAYRLSVGWATTSEEIAATVDAVRQLSTLQPPN